MRSKSESQSLAEAGWCEWRRQQPCRIPRGLRPWLADQGSLTRRLQNACGPRFRVRLLRQGWGRPFDSERRLLGMRPGEIALVREVQLLCADRPWVFARTVIPVRSLRGGARRLTRLGQRPLGAVLFSDRRVRRGLVEIARLCSRQRLFVAAARDLVDSPAELWGRRTLFYYGRHPLLVNEIFLPAIEAEGEAGGRS